MSTWYLTLLWLPFFGLMLWLLYITREDKNKKVEDEIMNLPQDNKKLSSVILNTLEKYKDHNVSSRSNQFKDNPEFRKMLAEEITKEVVDWTRPKTRDFLWRESKDYKDF